MGHLCKRVFERDYLGFSGVIWGRVQGNEVSLPAGAAKKEGNSMICYPNTSYLYKDRLDRGRAVIGKEAAGT